jgi:nucleoside-diphosphate-sugar epimerase
LVHHGCYLHGDGNQTRDFTYVEDAVSANLLSLEATLKPGEVFNVAAGRQISLNELASEVERTMGKTGLGSSVRLQGRETCCTAWRT